MAIMKRSRFSHTSHVNKSLNLNESFRLNFSGKFSRLVTENELLKMLNFVAYAFLLSKIANKNFN